MSSSIELSIGQALRAVIFWVFLLEGFVTLIFVLDASVPRFSISIAAILGTALFSVIVFLGFRSTRVWLAPEIPTGARRRNLAGLILLGLAIRVGWLIAVPPIQTSDYVRYLTVARTLLSQHTYFETVQDHTFRAFTPPGLPMFLAAGIRLFGDGPWTPAFLNLVLFTLTCLVIAVICSRLFGWFAALFSVALFALWPCDIGLTGLAASEPLFGFLFMAGCLFIFLPGPAALRWSPICGIAAGLATLTRPTALTLPALWIVAMLILGIGRERIKALVVASVLLVLTVSPWAIRNYHVFGEFVAVSTNGGDVFYRANNPLATGSWTARGERDLSPYLSNEILWNKTGFAWGKEWVRAHPLRFFRLAVKKQFVFLGSDETGVYWTIERPHPEWTTARAVGKFLSDCWWLALWVLLLFALILHRKHIHLIPELICLLLPFLYFLGIHSIFESQERYHIPAVPYLLIASALAFRNERICSTLFAKTHEYTLQTGPVANGS